jgi:hypothetical protein
VVPLQRYAHGIRRSFRGPFQMTPSLLTTGVQTRKSLEVAGVEHVGQIPAVPEYAGSIPKPYHLTSAPEWNWRTYEQVR